MNKKLLNELPNKNKAEVSGSSLNKAKAEFPDLPAQVREPTIWRFSTFDRILIIAIAVSGCLAVFFSLSAILQCYR